MALGAVATDGVWAAGCHHHRPGIKASVALLVALATVVTDTAPIEETVAVLAVTFALAAIIAAAAAEHVAISVARVVTRCAAGRVRGTARPATSVDSSIHAPMTLSTEVRADAARVPVGAGAAFALVLVAKQFACAARLNIPRIVDTAAFADLAVPPVAKLLAGAALVVSHPRCRVIVVAMALLTVPAVLFTKTAVVIAALTGRVAVLRAPVVVRTAPHALETFAMTLRLCGARELTHLGAPSVLWRAPHSLCAVGHAWGHLLAARCVIRRARVKY